MSVAFNSTSGHILVPVDLFGPIGQASVLLILDTGATRTLIHPRILTSVGHNPSLVPAQVTMTSASGQTAVPLVPVAKLTALGHDSVNFPVLAHALPANAPADGLLGLDFLRGKVLQVNFQVGQITLT